ncbi:MAG: Plasma membrane t-SNARE, secretory vesicle fusion [Thelocarpon superellum]|nr:MAG: Plasma membrane t-SNARE, secretory vesicle fusion [Thelocarpon superellum]
MIILATAEEAREAREAQEVEAAEAATHMVKTPAIHTTSDPPKEVDSTAKANRVINRDLSSSLTVSQLPIDMDRKRVQHTGSKVVGLNPRTGAMVDMDRGNQGQNDVELGQIDSRPSNYGPVDSRTSDYGRNGSQSQGMGGMGASLGSDPNSILNECREVDRGVDEIERYIDQLKGAQKRYFQGTDRSRRSAPRQEVDRLHTDTKTLFQNLLMRMRKIKALPESGSPKNAAQVGKVDRRLKTAFNQYQIADRDFRKQVNATSEREIRIVNPNATDAEVREAVESDNDGNIFSQALLQGDRRGQAQTVLSQVSDRHEMIQKIEQQMIELAEMFQEMDAMVVQQEPAVMQIEQQGEQVTQDVTKANEEIAGAVVKAKARNRKKWWCLLIAVLIIVVIIIIVVVVVEVLKVGQKSTQAATGST